jgi:hypothetical protein
MGKMSWKSMENQRIYGWDIMEYDGGLLIPPKKPSVWYIFGIFLWERWGDLGDFVGHIPSNMMIW